MMTSLYSCKKAIPTLLHLVKVCTFISYVTTVVLYDGFSFTYRYRDVARRRTIIVGNTNTNNIIWNPIIYSSQARTSAIQPTQLKKSNDNGGIISSFEDQDDYILDEEDDVIMNVLLLTKIDELLLELGIHLMPNNKEIEEPHEIT